MKREKIDKDFLFSLRLMYSRAEMFSRKGYNYGFNAILNLYFKIHKLYIDDSFNEFYTLDAMSNKYEKMKVYDNNKVYWESYVRSFGATKNIFEFVITCSNKEFYYSKMTEDEKNMLSEKDSIRSIRGKNYFMFENEKAKVFLYKLLIFGEIFNMNFEVDELSDVFKSTKLSIKKNKVIIIDEINDVLRFCPIKNLKLENNYFMSESLKLIFGKSELEKKIISFLEKKIEEMVAKYDLELDDDEFGDDEFEDDEFGDDEFEDENKNLKSRIELLEKENEKLREKIKILENRIKLGGNKESDRNLSIQKNMVSQKEAMLQLKVTQKNQNLYKLFEKNILEYLEFIKNNKNDREVYKYLKKVDVFLEICIQIVVFHHFEDDENLVQLQFF